MKDWNVSTILLGYDGSEGADQAAELASAVARRNNALIMVVTAFQVGGRDWPPDAVKDSAGSESIAAQDTAREIVLKLRDAGVRAEPHVLEEKASEALLHMADSRDADLIVVGSRGRGRTAELLLGSTSEEVVRQAKVPVLVAH